MNLKHYLKTNEQRKQTLCQHVHETMYTAMRLDFHTTYDRTKTSPVDAYSFMLNVSLEKVCDVLNHGIGGSYVLE